MLLVFVHKLFIHHIQYNKIKYNTIQYNTHKCLESVILLLHVWNAFCWCIIIGNITRFTTCGPRPRKLTGPQHNNGDIKYVVI